ncbi:MAG: diguanylate cyclase, partial [Rhodocyclaceae bacterium]|nr:diguanylate cyclase [Rhodocyclaceae bacterium]
MSVFHANSCPITTKMTMMTTSIEQITHPGILTCAPTTSLFEAAQRMMASHCSSIFIEDEGEIVGVWTEHDALMIATQEQLFLSTIAEHMISPVQTIGLNASLGETALRFHEESLRHFLVLDEANNPWGVVTQSDVVMAQGVSNVYLREIGGLLHRDTPVISATTTIDDVVCIMKNDHIDAVAVRYGDNEPLGIFTERDIVRMIGTGTSFATVGDLASRPLISVQSSSTLYQARKMFIDKHIRHLGIIDEEGQFRGVIAFSDLLMGMEHDYTHELRGALKESEHSLAISHRHNRLAEKAFENTFEGIMVSNVNKMIEWVNPAFTQIIGFAAHEAIGKPLSLFASEKYDDAFFLKIEATLHQDGRWQGELWGRKRNGEIIALWMTMTLVMDDDHKPINYVSIFSDITHRKAAEEQMHFLAYHDALTGLSNRLMLKDRLQHAISHAHRNRQMVGIMMIDLDHFKQINDTLGHQAGDRLLQVVAQRLIDCVREEDTAARLGGDEFVLIIERVDHLDVLSAIAQKVTHTLSQPVLLDDREMTITTSMGISIFPADGDLPDDLIKQADHLMYLAKQGGRNNFVMSPHGVSVKDIPHPLPNPPLEGEGVSLLPLDGEGVSLLPLDGEGVSLLPLDGEGVSILPLEGEG